MTRCIFCKGTEFISIEVPDVMAVDGKEYADTVPAEKCASCGEHFIAGPDLAAREDRLIAELEKVNNPSPGIVKYIERHRRGRKKLAKLREEASAANLRRIGDIVTKELAAQGRHESLEVLGWDVVEGDDEGEEHLQVDYLLPNYESEANIVSTTLIAEVLKDHNLNLSSLPEKHFKRRDRDELVDAMYTSLGLYP